MKIVLLRATGNVGSRLIAELVRRGHFIPAVARHPEKLTKQEEVTAQATDVANEDALPATLHGWILMFLTEPAGSRNQLPGL